jgi:signal transduction histidine kinase
VLCGLLPAFLPAAFAPPGAGQSAPVRQQGERPAVPPTPVRNVLVLYSNDRLLPANIVIDGRLREAFERARTPFRIQDFSEFLDTERFPGSDHEAQVASFLRDKYARYPLDLLIAAGPEARDFLVHYRTHIRPNAPIVFLSAGGLLRDARSPAPPVPNMTGVRMDWAECVAPTLDLILRLQPRARRVVVIGDETAVGMQLQAEARLVAEPYRGRGVEIACWFDKTMPQLEAEAAALPDDAVILFSQIFRDAAGQAFLSRFAMERIAKAARVPVYGCYSTYIGHGALGGVMTTFEMQGDAAAGLALRVLNGEDAGKIPAIGTPRRPVVDARMLERWRIPEDRLPPGAEVRFRELTAWERYRPQIVGIGAAFTAQSALLAGLLLQRLRRRRAEEALRRSEEREQLTTAAAGMGLWSWPTTGNFIEADERTGALLACPPERRLLRYREFFARVHPDDCPALERVFRTARTRGGDFAEEFRIVLAGDETRWRAIRGRAAPPDSGRPGRLDGVIYDITPRKRAEEEALRHRQEIAHVSRAGAMGEMAASIAHELSQPLGAILANIGAAEMLLTANPPDVAEVRDILREIREDDHRARDIIRGMREMLRRRVVANEGVDLNELAAATMRLVAPDARLRQVAIHLDLDPALAAVSGERVHLQQVLLNLMLNAMDAMAGQPAAERRLVVRTCRARNENGEAAEISVSDTGPGIGPDALPRLFEPFFTTKKDGMGMGLSIARTIVEAHGGSLDAENRPEGGARFRILLPAPPDGLAGASEERGERKP